MGNDNTRNNNKVFIRASGLLLQDGNITTQESRWSCSPALGDAGSTCSITYSLTDALYIEELKIGELFESWHSRPEGIDIVTLY